VIVTNAKSAAWFTASIAGHEQAVDIIAEVYSVVVGRRAALVEFLGDCSQTASLEDAEAVLLLGKLRERLRVRRSRRAS